MKKFIDSENTEKAFLGKCAQDLLFLTSHQVVDVYLQRGILIPVEVSSTLLYLHKNKNVALANLATALNLAHQLIAQRVTKLIKLGLIKKVIDKNDLRRTNLILTQSGVNQATLLDKCMDDMALVYTELYKEIGCDLPQYLTSAINSLKQKTISERFSEKFK